MISVVRTQRRVARHAMNSNQRAKRRARRNAMTFKRRAAADRAAMALVFALSLLSVGCSTRDRKSDTTNATAAARGDSVGDLSGAPRSPDSASPGGRAPSSPARTPASSGSAGGVGKPATTPATRAPVTPKSDTTAQHRNDGSMTNPPIHRTIPGEGAGEPSFTLMSEINALAKPGGCSRAGDCQSLPVGRKACGGPRTYVVFCAKSTNVAALRAKIAELDRLDVEAAKTTASDCMMVMPPHVTLSGGVCRASNDREAPR